MKLNETMKLFSLISFSKQLFFHYARKTRPKENTWEWDFFANFKGICWWLFKFAFKIYLFKNSLCVFAFLLSSIQYLKDLNVIMSNEVEKILKYNYVLKLLLRYKFTGCTVGESRWNGLNALLFFLGKSWLSLLMSNFHSFLTLF